jgi:hypothetical protein
MVGRFGGTQEPELLRVDAERVRRQMQEVAVENYGAFIAASEALSFIRAQLEGFDSHLEALVMRPIPPCSLVPVTSPPASVYVVLRVKCCCSMLKSGTVSRSYVIKCEVA